jgi:cobalt-zinc-cadmium efflux system protein
VSGIPSRIENDIRHAVRLEWWTIGWQLSIIVILALVLGSSQAMKTAWIEDTLGLVPACVFLISLHFERKESTRKFPYGFLRVNSLAFLIAATALAFMGAYLIIDAGIKLWSAEHPTIGPITVFGQSIWLGWLMMAALAYSVIPPVILGSMKLPLARRLNDKVLHTDALMQKADWMTGVAATLGIAGVGFGLWWADSAAAAIIAIDILHDGIRALRIATAELVDGAPRALDSDQIDPEAAHLHQRLETEFGSSAIRMRETGRYIIAQVHGAKRPRGDKPLDELWPNDPKRSWRFADLSVVLHEGPSMNKQPNGENE